MVFPFCFIPANLKLLSEFKFAWVPPRVRTIVSIYISLMPEELISHICLQIIADVFKTLVRISNITKVHHSQQPMAWQRDQSKPLKEQPKQKKGDDLQARDRQISISLKECSSPATIRNEPKDVERTVKDRILQRLSH